MNISTTGMIRMAIYLIIIFGIVFSLLIYFVPFNFAPSNPNNEKVIYFADNITPWHEKIIHLFNKQHEGKIKVVAVNLPHSLLNTNKRKALVTNNLRNQGSKIDLFAIDHIWLPRFAKWSEPLDKYFLSEELNTIEPRVLEPCYKDENLYAIPFFYDLGVMFYRKDILQSFKDSQKWQEILKRGITWSELDELKKAHFQHAPFYVIQAKDYEGLICNYVEIGAGKNISVFRNNNFYFESPEIFDLNTFILDLIYKKEIIPVESLNYDEQSSFRHGLQNNYFMLRGWVSNPYNLDLPPTSKEKVKNLIMVPLPAEKQGYFRPSLGGWNIIISKYSRKKEEAVKFLKFIVSQDIQEEQLQTGWNIPILKNMRFENPPQNRFTSEIIKRDWIRNSMRRPSNPDYTRISDTYSRLLNKILRKEIDITTALKEAQIASEEINK